MENDPKSSQPGKSDESQNPSQKRRKGPYTNPPTYKIPNQAITPDPELAKLKQEGTPGTFSERQKPTGSFVFNRYDDESIPVRLIPSEGGFDETNDSLSDEKLWNLIKKRTINFSVYVDLMNTILRCNPGNIAINQPDGTITDKPFYKERDKELAKNRLPFTSSAAYSLLKFATEKFVKATVDLNDTEFWAVDDTLTRSPYTDMILNKIFDFRDQLNQSCGGEQGLITLKTKPVLIELIWSYWHEEGMLVQTINSINKRFQNVRNGPRDPLANLEIDPLRPLNNILWGYIQDSQHRLTVSRRTYEYDHHYGIQLIGSTIPNFSPADSRSKFIAAFHNLLYRCAIFYKEADDLTRRADGFGILNALKEVHLLLSEGAHNQFGDLPTTARIEMMIEQWILSQPEIREFLGGRVMTPYDEPWMDRVDTMKNLQGWPQTSVSYYHDLGRFGEQILLSIRWANWTQVNDRDFASGWANEWRNAIQRYIHCYHTVSGMDLGIDTIEHTSDRKYLMPSLLIQQKFLREKALRKG